jgi:hypothetical protein
MRILTFIVAVLCLVACAEPAPPVERRTDETAKLLGKLERTGPSPPTRRSPPASPPQDTRPAHRGEGLSREEIQQGMRASAKAVQACYDRYKRAGMYAVTVTIATSGVPREVRPGGTPPDQATAACVCAAVKATARFPSYTGEEVTITYPFIFR